MKSTAAFFPGSCAPVERCSHVMFLLLRDLRDSLRQLFESLLESDGSQSSRASTCQTISLSTSLLETNFRVGPIRHKKTDDLAPDTHG